LCWTFPKNLKVRNATKLNQEGTLRQVAADGNVKAGTLLPIHFDWWSIENCCLKFLALGGIANRTWKFDEPVAFMQQHVVITYHAVNSPRLITGMQPLECIVDHLLKFLEIQTMNTAHIITGIDCIKARNNNNQLITHLHSYNVIGWKPLVYWL
jgi:hypothetical protein